MNFTAFAEVLSGWRGYALVAAVAFAAGGFTTGYVQGAIYDARIATIEKSHADEAADQARTALAEIVRLQTLIAGIDADNLKELNENAATVDKLRADVRAGLLRLSIRTAGPVAAAAPGVGDEAARAELDPEDADALLRITGEGDEAIIQLTACQAYAAGVSTPAKAP